jgi:hypothetical protein
MMGMFIFFVCFYEKVVTNGSEMFLPNQETEAIFKKAMINSVKVNLGHFY